MKILAIICEFNPFHNGHEYLLKQAKQLGYDATLCIMSGSFTQRGEICIADKYIRATHAIKAGCDCVIELPAAFSVAPAEIFAKGAIKILSSVSSVKAIAFGHESGTKNEFIETAKLLTSESDQFKEILKNNLSENNSYIKSFSKAVKAVGGNGELLSNPNNILAIEYTKAILHYNAGIEIYPIKRIGSGFSDPDLKENFSSASAIRKNLSSKDVKNNVPDYVYADLKDFSQAEKRFNWVILNELLRTDPQTLAGIYGCSEGLENRIISLSEEYSCNEIIEKCTSKRYSSSRIRRILCANLLKLYQKDCEKYLISELYIRPLAAKKAFADSIFSELAKGDYPLLLRNRDAEKLSETAKNCYKSDEYSYKLWRLIANENLKNLKNGIELSELSN